jgi:hypothetical protein
VRLAAVRVFLEGNLWAMHGLFTSALRDLGDGTRVRGQAHTPRTTHMRRVAGRRAVAATRSRASGCLGSKGSAVSVGRAMRGFDARLVRCPPTAQLWAVGCGNESPGSLGARRFLRARVKRAEPTRLRSNDRTDQCERSGT